MSEHTKDPWIVIEINRIISQNDQLNNAFFIADCFGPDSPANARRIVACVNACEGLSNEYLDAKPLKYLDADLFHATEQFALILAQRDELLEALIDIHRYAQHLCDIGAGVSGRRSPKYQNSIDTAKAAIAKCESK